MEKKEYIERHIIEKSINDSIPEKDWLDNAKYQSERSFILGVMEGKREDLEAIKETKSSDVVPWSWLQSYADGKRCNYASDFVVEAKEVWENGTADKTCE